MYNISYQTKNETQVIKTSTVAVTGTITLFESTPQLYYYDW